MVVSTTNKVENTKETGIKTKCKDMENSTIKMVELLMMDNGWMILYMEMAYFIISILSH